MRIIAGVFKSRLIDFPKAKITRPMMDRMRESVFNILGQTLDGLKVLDLFAGSGSVGLEAISRGANHVTFVEQDLEAIGMIKKNLDSLGVTRDRYDIFQGSASQVIRRLSQRAFSYDLIFLDPPYNKGLIKKTLRQLERSVILPKFGKIVIHRASQEGMELAGIRRFQLETDRPLGQAFISVLMAIEPCSQVKKDL
ncbi:MAG: 16S rRNA (guanine(966)-N(2))-methyltransferase RsmD [Candidatus Omnitrophica bacterium CG11_big_fil_rev_8_21_14_0_20_45_26]|uniref:16S rRNA (Guanine(966)-N(2))-methyltransferase RsmD n=1 Tax=Candidatus Abzuiibacterium crystallinum TaxID=1974748 RepID=A0A2H0LSF1_9BACT|nr:MAG: 16S rRNA (guanine(966)-N(2))-methyltransferase RsmD [Candidatus Omnitrophica bacterium CG11_big_fil_rev_8_21_14_0_20_45_26]PIW65045.1 MAG: 16S rRNA (guanine(966)-N(2))-methyltransferase RsmD [Candidatus Omnitrophica bacterium CG12_big_fil_rev_8_21_14_0_65_45_16]